MNVRVGLPMATQLVQTRSRSRGRGRGRFVSGTFPGGRGARIGRGHPIVNLDLVRVFS